MVHGPFHRNRIGLAEQRRVQRCKARVDDIVALRRRQGRASAASAAVVFIAFGVSDIVETTTGAWWRPWWLLVWKGVCVLALLTLFVRWRRPAAG